MANNIANITVPAPVIQLKNDLYLVEGQYAPRTLNIPCGVNALVDDIQHWFVPVKDSGVCTTCSIVPAIGDYPVGTPPTSDSLLVLRVRDKYTPFYTWWVVCTIAQYYASCQTCCDDAFVPIPPSPELPVIVPCQDLCSQNDAGNYYAVFAAPDITGVGFEANVQIDGDVVEAPMEGSNLDLLIGALNAQAGTGGSPSMTIVWTNSGNTIIATVQNGEGVGQSICLVVLPVEV